MIQCKIFLDRSMMTNASVQVDLNKMTGTVPHNMNVTVKPMFIPVHTPSWTTFAKAFQLRRLGH